MIAETSPFGLPFEEAIGHFQAKGMKISPDSWRDVWQQAHARSFTVARVTAMDVLADIRGEVQKALDAGVSLDEFKQQLRPILEKKGWFVPSGEKAIERLPDGTTRKRLTPWRLDTIYRTNLQTAYSTGRYRQLMEVADDRPYWQYKAVMDSRTRATHAAMNNKVYEQSHPIWNTWYPPNGFNCRCYVKAFTTKDLDRRGLKASTRGVDIQPDEGWRYSPGKAGLDAGWQPEIEKYSPELAREYVREAVSSNLFSRFMEGGSQIDFPVAIMDAVYRIKIKAKTKTVYFSPGSLAKNLASHPDLVIDDYRRVQEVIEQAQTIIQDGDRTLVFLKMDGKIFHAVVKSTDSGKKLFMTSYRLTNIGDVQRAKQRGIVIKDEM